MFALLRGWFTHHTKWLIFVLLAIMVENFIELAIPFVLANFIDDVLMPKEYELIEKYCKAFFVLILFEIIVQYASAIFSAKLITKVIAHAEQETLRSITKFPYDFFRNKQSGYLADQINRDICDLIMFAINSCVLIVAGMASLAGSFSYLLFLDVTYLVVFFIMIAAYIVFYYLIKNKLKSLSFETRESESNFFNIIVKVISFIKPVKIHELYSVYADELRKEFDVWHDVNVKREKLSYWFSSSRTITGRVFIFINFFYGGMQVIDGHLAVGQFVAINTYFLLALSGATSFLNLAQNYQDALSAYKRINVLRQQEIETYGYLELNDRLERIDIQDLNYSINGTNIIKSFSKRFVRGNIYCIIGENGAGKSTLFNLLVGLVKPDDGNILFNGEPLWSYDINSLRRKNVGLVDQEAFICEPLILNNKLNHELLSKFNLELDIIKKVRQFDKNLSGGEKQKLTILQFLNPDAQLLLLDEPTASMDKEDSRQLWEYLFKIKEDAIILVISHKEEELKYADDIVRINSDRN